MLMGLLPAIAAHAQAKAIKNTTHLSKSCQCGGVAEMFPRALLYARIWSKVVCEVQQAADESGETADQESRNPGGGTTHTRAANASAAFNLTPESRPVHVVLNHRGVVAVPSCCKSWDAEPL